MTDDLPARAQVEDSLIYDVYIRCLCQFEDENDPGRIAGEAFWCKRERRPMTDYVFNLASRISC